MSGTPRYKIFRSGEYVAAAKYAEDAAAAVACFGDTVKLEGRIVWREGKEEIEAAESYDRAAEIMVDRYRRADCKSFVKRFGSEMALKVGFTQTEVEEVLEAS